MVVRVLGDHLRKVKLTREGGRHRHADEAARVRCHEVDVLRRGEFGRADKIALVFALLVVRDDDNSPGA